MQRILRHSSITVTTVLAGLRADELRQADIGDIRTTDDSAAVIHVKDYGGKERSVPIEAELLSVIEDYLDSRANRFAAAAKRNDDVAGTETRSAAARNRIYGMISRSDLDSDFEQESKELPPLPS